MAPDISANNLEELNQAGIEFNYFLWIGNHLIC